MTSLWYEEYSEVPEASELVARLVVREYTGSAMTEQAFAEYASKRLGFRLTRQMVRTAREKQEIPVNMAGTTESEKWLNQRASENYQASFGDTDHLKFEHLMKIKIK